MFRRDVHCVCVSDLLGFLLLKELLSALVVPFIFLKLACSSMLSVDNSCIRCVVLKSKFSHRLFNW